MTSGVPAGGDATHIPTGAGPRLVRVGLGLVAVMLASVPNAIGQPGAAVQPAVPPVQAAVPGVAVNLNITPKRLILDRSTRAGTVYIFNQGTGPATFDISLVERVMLPNGEISVLDDARSDPRLQPIVSRLASAQPMLVATPRRVTLAAGRGQTIRIRATPPSGATGEYRTHLTVTTVPPREAGLTAEQAQAAQSGQLSFRINSVFGLSIPVIVRAGRVDARGAIENARIAHVDMVTGEGAAVRTPVVQFEIRRLGTASLFGNLEVRSSESGERGQLGLTRGVGVYPEIDTRTMQIPLRRELRRGEQVSVTFTDDDGTPGRVIARAVLTGS